MKNLPKIMFAFLTVASLYACNKQEELDAMNVHHGHNSERTDSLDWFSNDTTYYGTNPVDSSNTSNPTDTTYYGNNPVDTTYYGGNPIDTAYQNNPYDTIWSNLDTLGR